MQHPQRQTGFTLIELMIVVAIIAIIASIAIPNLLSARLRANESAAIATLRNFASAQAQCKASTAVDVNNNGTGEFGFLCELGASRGIRGADGNQSVDFLSPKLISLSDGTSVTLGNGAAAGAMKRSGYLFAILLPSSDKQFTPEHPNGGSGSGLHNPDPQQAENFWCMYAWPLSAGNSGQRCFFVNQAGDMYSAKNAASGPSYSGTDRAPAPSAAFHHSVVNVAMDSTIAANATGLDGQVWNIIN